MQNYINIILGAKGGIGKTVLTTYLAEYLKIKMKQTVSVIDTDTNNSGLRQYGFFKTNFVDFKDETGAITSVSIQNIAQEFSQKNIIIDTGANSYYAWFSYLKDMFGIEMLSSSGAKVLLHVPLVPGQMKQETFNCLDEIVNANLGNDNCRPQIIVHLNNGFNSFGQGIRQDKLPSPLDFSTKTEFAKYKGKVHYVVEEPRIPITMKFMYDSLRNQHIAISELADCSMEDLKKFQLTSPNGKENRQASIIDKKSCQIIRNLIFMSYQNLDPLYNVK